VKEEDMSDNQNSLREPVRLIRPRSTMTEDNGVITMSLEMPGVPKDGVDLEVEGTELRIRGRRAAATEARRYVVRERAVGDYAEVFTIDETVDREKIGASMEAGVLTVTLQLREAEKPRRIAITTR
jgi:HSP20 family protein